MRSRSKLHRATRPGSLSRAGPTSPLGVEVKYPARVGTGSRPALVVRCECGFEVRGTEDEIVPALQKHAGESHNMKVTREQVLARAHAI